jgi:ACS family glucarate transporter-like MFS transporter/ACS family D-galactonate transporter-like MFS transporter
LVITSINYVQRNPIAPAATTMERSLGVSPQQLDLTIGAFFLAYTLMQVPSGWLSQRWGPRLALTVFAAGWSLAMLGCALARGFPDLYLARLAMGVLQAGIFPCATLILSVWYPASRRGLATALLNSFMLIGGAVSTTLTALLLKSLGWRLIFGAYAVPGLVWAAWFFWWFRDRPQDHPAVNEAEREVIAEGRPPADREKGAAVRPGVPWLALLGSVPLILLCSQQFFRAGANRLFDSRLPTYFEKVRGASPEEAGLLGSVPLWAGVLGGVLGGGISDKVLARTRSRRLARRGVAIASLLAAVALYLLAYLIANVTLATLVLSTGFFIFCFSSPCAYALTMDISGKYLAIVFGLMNMAGNLGATVFTSTISALVELGGWELALGVWISMHLAAVACWFFLDPEIVIGEPRRKE